MNRSTNITTSPLFTAVSDEGFDPISDLFVAQAAKPAHLTDLNLRALTPFQRALLVIDGTVTKFIEAYTMEPVEVVRLSQETRRLTEDHDWLEVPKNTDVIARQVILRGKYSYTFHAYAVSLIVPGRLEEVAQSGLIMIDDEGLGRLLLNNQVETRREVLWYGKEGVDQAPDGIRHWMHNECISRTYRIIAASRPIMLINEKFPYTSDQLPSHH